MKKGTLNWILAGLFVVLGAVIYMIPGMKFSALFCVGLALLCVIGHLLENWAKKNKAGKVCKVIFHYGVILGFTLLLIIEGYLLSRAGEDFSALPADAVIVLGAGVNGERPSLALQSRIDAVEEYLQEHPDIPVVLSGGQGPGEDITEAEAMYRALKTEDEAENSRFILEEKSTSTEENLAFSKELLLQNGIDPAEDTIAIVTNDFHLVRARMLAEEQGYETAYGVGAPIPWWWLQVNYYLREAFALVKDIVF